MDGLRGCKAAHSKGDRPIAPGTAICYAMLGVAVVVALRGGAPLVLSAMASGGPAALTMWGGANADDAPVVHAGVCWPSVSILLVIRLTVVSWPAMSSTAAVLTRKLEQLTAHA